METAARVARRDRRTRGVKLFRFTKEEESRIDAAIQASEVFMASYGKGRDPYMINRKNYLCDE